MIYGQTPNFVVSLSGGLAQSRCETSCLLASPPKATHRPQIMDFCLVVLTSLKKAASQPIKPPTNFVGKLFFVHLRFAGTAQGMPVVICTAPTHRRGSDVHLLPIPSADWELRVPA